MKTKTVPDMIIIPLKQRVLFRKDDDKSTTHGGIVLPDSAKIPTITGRILKISPDLENDEMFPVRQYDKVLIDPTDAIPVELDSGNKQFIVPVECVIAVFKKGEEPKADDEDMCC